MIEYSVFINARFFLLNSLKFLQKCCISLELTGGDKKKAIKARFLRFYSKLTAIEAIEPDIIAAFNVSAIPLE
ncbi:MAG: hypothetical protein ACHQF0_13585 [Chitinophagales bacterium]